jgi:hypothetical protein
MTIKNTVASILFLLITTLLILTSCRKDEFNTDPGFKLGFSNDTVIFDTVFTTIGSVTRQLVIRNSGNSKINISKITLARGLSSPFRINIDGTATEAYENLEIGANDSAYIFVKVTIDPNNINTPFIESDSIVFETNGNIQNVKLVAWGQNAYFHLNEVLSGNVTLPVDKPHVIYGNLTAKKDCNLTLAAGTMMYFHNSSSLEILSGASLNVEGTLELPVTFTDDRLEEYYRDKPGMWDGIWLENGCKKINITYAYITNAIVGIQADSTGLDNGDTLLLHNCEIHNMTNYGLRATKARVFATNCQITNCGGNVVAIENGGNYDFRNCTLARYFVGRGYPALSISNYTTDTAGKVLLPGGALTGAYFGNCIITGNLVNEIELLELPGTEFNFSFDYCLANWDKEKYKGKEYELKFTNCIENEDAKFIAPYENNFELDTLSVAINAASWNIIYNWVPSITHDIKGVSRITNGLPDMGTFERVEKN